MPDSKATKRKANARERQRSSRSRASQSSQTHSDNTSVTSIEIDNDLSSVSEALDEYHAEFDEVEDDETSVVNADHPATSETPVKNKGGRPRKNAKGAGHKKKVPIVDSASSIPGDLASDMDRSAQTDLTSTYELSFDDSTLASDRDSLLMPAPSSTIVRRSTRTRRTTSTFSIASSTPSEYREITNSCQRSHVGYGCASKKAGHLPPYYNPLEKGTHVCPHCKAALFYSETVGNKAYSKCCAKGRVHAAMHPGTRITIPERFAGLQVRSIIKVMIDFSFWASLNACAGLWDLFEVPRYTIPQLDRIREHIFRHPILYNDHLSFGRIRIQRETNFQESQRIVKCNMMIQYLLYDFQAPQGPDGVRRPSLAGQLFTLPNDSRDERIRQIVADHSAQGLNEDAYRYLFEILRQHHWMATMYETGAAMFRQVEEQNPQDALSFRLRIVDEDRRGNDRVNTGPTIHGLDVTGIHPADRLNIAQVHPGCLGVPTPNGHRIVAQVYLDDGENSAYQGSGGILLTGRRGTGQRHMPWWNRDIGPALFPLLFPMGQFEFESGFLLRAMVNSRARRPSNSSDDSLDCARRQRDASVSSSESNQCARKRPRTSAPVVDDECSDESSEHSSEMEALDSEDGTENNGGEESQGFATGMKRFVSRIQWIRYMMHSHDGQWLNWHWLWKWKGLAQLYVISFWNRAEAQRVQALKRVQGKKRTILSRALLNWLDALRRKQHLPGEIGRRIYFTTENFRASKQFYQREFANCMTICRFLPVIHPYHLSTCRFFGSVDLLVTFTMDPVAVELESLIPVGERWFDRPDIVCRLFIDKTRELYKDLTQRQVLGPVMAWFGFIEHQNRGLPHVHICLILNWDKITLTKEEYIEQYICAELPDKPTRTRSIMGKRVNALYETILTKHIHTCTKNRCLRDDGTCSKRFPRKFSRETVYRDNAYPIYIRRPPAITAEERQECAENPQHFGNSVEITSTRGRKKTVTNAYVVPYNPFLSAKYLSHINVEMVAGDGCLGYVINYCTKGADGALVMVDEDGQQRLSYDEFHQIRLARYMTSPEAFLAIWGEPIARRSHKVAILEVHLPDTDRVTFEEGEELPAAEQEERRVEAEIPKPTMLTAYFQFNGLAKVEGKSLGLTYDKAAYTQIRYDRVRKIWRRYVNGPPKNMLVRIRTVSPHLVQLLAIRLLLLVVVDPCSWEELRTVDGHVFATFQEAARERGLLDDNVIWRKTVDEAFRSKRRAGQRMRWLAVFFATTNLSNPGELLDYILDQPEEWLLNTRVAGKDREVRKQYVLNQLEWFLRAHGVRPNELRRDDDTYESACEAVHLPRPDDVADLTDEQIIQSAFFRDNFIYGRIDPVLREPSDRPMTQAHYEFLYRQDPQPNDEQKLLLDEIWKAAHDSRAVINTHSIEQELWIDPAQNAFTPNLNRYFFVCGEGGSGKTMTFNKLIARLKGTGKFNVLPMASTGIAAELLYEGCTLHRRICRARHVDANMEINFENQSQFAEILRRAHVLIIDEVSMMNRGVLEYVDKVLRAVAPCPLKFYPFGGKVVILGGDWKQLLPVVIGPGKGPWDQFVASFKCSDLFANFISKTLKTNHRLIPGQMPYRNWMKLIGSGFMTDNQERVEIPSRMILRSEIDLLDTIFPRDITAHMIDRWQELTDRAILCPRNDSTLRLNKEIMRRIPGNYRIYDSYTRLIPGEGVELNVNYAAVNLEVLQSKTPPGIPEHRLEIKVGAVMLVIYNVAVDDGLCNGTRVQILAMGDHTLTCRLLTGTRRGEEFELFRHRFVYGNDPKAPAEGPYRCQRIQFPLRPGSVMTINKAQGQTLGFVGVQLDTAQCFAHGHLYVALSRVRDPANIRVLLKPPHTILTTNTVVVEAIDKEDKEEAYLLAQDRRCVDGLKELFENVPCVVPNNDIYVPARDVEMRDDQMDIIQFPIASSAPFQRTPQMVPRAPTQVPSCIQMLTSIQMNNPITSTSNLRPPPRAIFVPPPPRPGCYHSKNIKPNGDCLFSSVVRSLHASESYLLRQDIQQRTLRFITMSMIPHILHDGGDQAEVLCRQYEEGTWSNDGGAGGVRFDVRDIPDSLIRYGNYMQTPANDDTTRYGGALEVRLIAQYLRRPIVVVQPHRRHKLDRQGNKMFSDRGTAVNEDIPGKFSAQIFGPALDANNQNIVSFGNFNQLFEILSGRGLNMAVVIHLSADHYTSIYKVPLPENVAASNNDLIGQLNALSIEPEREPSNPVASASAPAPVFLQPSLPPRQCIHVVIDDESPSSPVASTSNTLAIPQPAVIQPVIAQQVSNTHHASIEPDGDCLFSAVIRSLYATENYLLQQDFEQRTLRYITLASIRQIIDEGGSLAQTLLGFYEEAQWSNTDQRGGGVRLDLGDIPGSLIRYGTFMQQSADHDTRRYAGALEIRLIAQFLRRPIVVVQIRRLRIRDHLFNFVRDSSGNFVYEEQPGEYTGQVFGPALNAVHDNVVFFQEFNEFFGILTGRGLNMALVIHLRGQHYTSIYQVPVPEEIAHMNNRSIADLNRWGIELGRDL